MAMNKIQYKYRKVTAESAKTRKHRLLLSALADMVIFIVKIRKQRNQPVLDFLPFLPRFLVPVRMSEATPSPTLLLPRAGALDALARAWPNLAHGDWP